MTEAEWLACTTPRPMLEFLRDKAGDRKLRLFAAACCRRAWDHIGGLAQRAVVVAERYADGEVGEDELAAVAAEWDATRGRNQLDHDPCTQALASPDRSLFEGGFYVLMRAVERTAQLVAGRRSAVRRRATEEAAQAVLLREIFGMPHRPIRLNRAWLEWNDQTVRKIAKAIYDERRFQDLPILADALLDAGCDNEELIEHCRSDSPHVRGCWALDLLLGKSWEALCPTDKDLAEFARLGLQCGVLDVRNVNAWSDAVISACDDPPSWVINLALTDSREPDATYSALAAIPGQTTPGIPTQLLLALARRRWRSGLLGPDRLREIAYQVQDRLPTPLGGFNWGFCLQADYEDGDGGHSWEGSIAKHLAPYALYEPLLPSWA